MQVDGLSESVLEKQWATTSAPGTCGELVQGQFESGGDFLVTLPVDLWSEVRVELNSTSSIVQGTPISKEKTCLAVRKTLDYLGYSNFGATFRVKSDIPEGKGMASSTADIVAACRATAQMTGRSLSPEEISHIAIAIEPSDGVMYPGVVCYNHRRGELIEALGNLPPLDILAVDLGGCVDTLQFNQNPKNYSMEELDEIGRAYELVKIGILEQNLEKIGLAATVSARVNQRLLPKPQLEMLSEISTIYGAHGVCVAHSGTIIGLLFEQGMHESLENTRDEIWQCIDPTLTIFALQSI